MSDELTMTHFPIVAINAYQNTSVNTFRKTLEDMINLVAVEAAPLIPRRL
ncbi:hypothetical protein SOVF_088490 [Spinacia oleracea]|nr:hypothetical protein SOVF_088490 [Spinacia oleracea]